MRIRYFDAAWRDIKNSPGWFGKLLLLGLVNLIPIFGTIVICGYAYGWARDMAWGVHAPLPAQVFGNEDGKLYRRGFFVLVIGIVCLLIPWVVDVLAAVVTGGGYSGLVWFGHKSGHSLVPLGLASGVVSLAFFAASVAAWFFSSLFSWIGAMRSSIYDRLSAGFQFGRMWAMIRHDFSGILRIFGMSLLLSCIMSIALMVIVSIVLLIALAVGFVAASGVQATSTQASASAAVVFAVVVAAFILLMLAGYVSMVMSAFVSLMTARAMGYWTLQFNVPAWRGQDDPMPFELADQGTDWPPAR